MPVSAMLEVLPKEAAKKTRRKKKRHRGGQRDVAEGENLPLVRQTPAEGDCASDSNPVDSFLKVQCVI